MRTYRHDVGPLAYASPGVILLALGGGALVVAGVLALGCRGLASAVSVPIVGAVGHMMGQAAAVALGAGVVALIAAAAVRFWMPDCAKIRYKVRRALWHPSFGNPLHLQEGERLPAVACKNTRRSGVYDLTISAGAVTVETIAGAASAISSALNGRYVRYAITQIDTGVAFDKVTFRIEDVLLDRGLTFHDVKEMQPESPTRLKVQQGADIDLTTSGSMLVAGKTRSGKTTGVISLLLQVLQCGRDKYGSECIVIDPKQAELSRLPHTVSLDPDGEATGILVALKRFATTITERQKTLNDLSEQRGDAVKWWDAGMHPSVLFLDEFVACRSIFPKKAAKDSDYCIDTFDNTLKRIVTMGASAGCYVIVSIAEASVQEGGLPAMLRSAMSTRILFRPTRAEGLLIWDRTKLDAMPARVYRPGDAWFSSTDGEHDAVSYVHFPVMHFKVYAELGRLLSLYYDDHNPAEAPPPPRET